MEDVHLSWWGFGGGNNVVSEVGPYGQWGKDSSTTVSPVLVEVGLGV